MSTSNACELSLAVRDRLRRCSNTEALGALADFAGERISWAPPSHRTIARALFIEMLDRALTNHVIGDPVGAA